MCNSNSIIWLYLYYIDKLLNWNNYSLNLRIAIPFKNGCISYSLAHVIGFKINIFSKI